MASLRNICEIVDDFVSGGASPDMEDSQQFWDMLSKDTAIAQMYAECLIYKSIALSCGLGGKPLHPTLTQIKNICAPSELRDHSSPSPITSPRGSLTPGSAKSKNADSSADYKSTPKKRFNSRRKSEDNKKSKKELTIDGGDIKRKGSKNMSKSTQNLDTCEQQDEKADLQNQTDLENVLLSLTYIAKMCDMSRWDFTKLRDVFLTWNKARGWEQMSSDYENMVMKRFSVFPTIHANNEEQIKKYFKEIFLSLNKTPNELAITDSRNLGESVSYWEIRHKILTRPEEAVAVIKCLLQVAKKVLEEGDETKILPTLHILCETLIMSPHTPLELLQECYSTFEQFYIWPSYVAHPVKEVLDMIQMEMKSPGHFYRMIFIQDCEIKLSSQLSAKMPSSETYVLVDSDVADSEALTESLKKLQQSRATSTKLTTDAEKYRFLIKHVFEAVFGEACCDMATLDQVLRSISDEVAQEKCFEALAIMEEASMKSSHRHAQDYLRSELEAFSETLGDPIDDLEKDSEGAEDSDTSKSTQGNNRRVTVLYEKCRIRESSASFSGDLNQSPLKNPYARRNTYSLSPADSRTTKKFSTTSEDRLSELIGSKVSTKLFTQADISETLYELVRSTAKQFVQEKKLGAGLSFPRKKDTSQFDEDQDDYRDSGVIDDEEPPGVSTGAEELHLNNGRKTTERRTPDNSTALRNKTQDSSSTESNDHDNFWKEFAEKGFDSDNDDLMELLKTMTFDQRKSFILDKKLQVKRTISIDIDPPPEINQTKPAPSPNIFVQSPDAPPETVASGIPENLQPKDDDSSDGMAAKFDSENAHKPIMMMRRKSSKSEHKTLNRISRFVRNKKKTGRKGRSDGDLAELSSAESLTSISSSTTSEDMVDGNSLRMRTSSETTLPRRKKGKRDSIVRQSPTKSKETQRHTLSGDILPSPLNLSVRSLPSRERISIFGNEFFIDEKTASLPQAGWPDSPRNSLSRSKSSDNQQQVLSLGSLCKIEFQLGVDDDDESRRRIDSGIGPDGVQDVVRRRTASSLSNHKEKEDLGIGGVKFALKETIRANKRWRASVSDDLEERTIHKKVLKLIFVGNDKTVGHLARAYYELRKRLMSRAPVFQHVDLRLFFIPVSSGNSAEKDDILSGLHPANCDIRIGELLGSYDSWYHTVVALSVNNLLRVYPKISISNQTKPEEKETPKKSLASNKILSPQEVIASAILSYSRFAVSRTDISMFKINMVSSSGDTFTDVFCCQLQVGHDAYKTAVKSGRYGKLGKLVDLSNDTGPPPAYTKIEYSKWSIDGRIVFSGEVGECFYHTVSVIPMPLLKNNFKGTDILQLLLIDNEKRQKQLRRNPNAKHSLTELAEVAGGILEIGNMKMEVMRPVQGTFALTLDNTKIYTNIKSIEVGPCFSPGAESMERSARNSSRCLREHHLTKLPLRTFWPTQL